MDVIPGEMITHLKDETIIWPNGASMVMLDDAQLRFTTDSLTFTPEFQPEEIDKYTRKPAAMVEVATCKIVLLKSGQTKAYQAKDTHMVQGGSIVNFSNGAKLKFHGDSILTINGVTRSGIVKDS